MEEINKEVLEILRKSLNQEKIEGISNWQEVSSELEKQAVNCLPYTQIKKSNVLNSTEINTYSISCMRMLAYNISVMRAQAKCLELLQSNGIPCVVLKGSAASMYYPVPLYRIMGDIDLIVKPEDFQRAYELFEENYVLEQKIEDCPRHAGFRTKEKIEIELHRYFSILNSNKELDNLIYHGIDHCEIHQIQDYSFPTLPPIENGLVLLYHIYQHLRETGIGYRQVIDFRQFLDANERLIPKFLKVAEQVHLRGLAEVMICICKKNFGLLIKNYPGIRSKQGVEDYLMELFATSGNFGKKEAGQDESKVEFVAKDFKNPIRGIRLLQKYGLQNWEAAKRHKILRPFAWIYQLCRYISHLKNYGGITGALKGSRRIYDKSRMFKELGLNNF